MTKFNVRTAATARTGTGPIATADEPAITAEGGAGWKRTPRAELFLLAVGSVDITADTFYQGGDERVARFTELVRTVAISDPAWIGSFLGWLRGPGNIRTASIVGAVEAARAMVQTQTPGSRAIVAAVLQRADEPGEMIAYHLQRYGKRIPKPIKRGIADAVQRLYTERNLLKYDTPSHAVRFGDVLELTHPAAPRYAEATLLFRHAIDRRHGRDTEIYAGLTMIETNAVIRHAVAEGDTAPLLSSSTLHMAGMTWEDALSLAGDRVDKRALWTALIPSMGYMALLRNLRNFDQAGVTDVTAMEVSRKLTDPAEVAKSRQLPMRFLSAYRNVASDRWLHPLGIALDLAVGNIPALVGNTLILIDTSGSMGARMSGRSELARWDAATMFGLALARRCERADVVSFSSSTKVFPVKPGESLLRSIERWRGTGYFLGAGTNTVDAVVSHLVRRGTRSGLRPHDRVVILTDEQFTTPVGYSFRGRDPGSAVPATTPLYTFNLAGYEAAQTQSNPYRVTLGGLTDAMFPLIDRIERGAAGTWPWETGGTGSTADR